MRKYVLSITILLLVLSLGCQGTKGLPPSLEITFNSSDWQFEGTPPLPTAVIRSDGKTRAFRLEATSQHGWEGEVQVEGSFPTGVQWELVPSPLKLSQGQSIQASLKFSASPVSSPQIILFKLVGSDGSSFEARLKIQSPPLAFKESETPSTAKEPPTVPEEKRPAPRSTVTPRTIPGEIQSSHFGFLGASFDAQGMSELRVRWDRPHPGPFIWGRIEPVRGQYHWQEADHLVEQNQIQGFGTLATIWPFAGWDQASWESSASATPLVFEQELGRSRHRPYDLEAYRKFVTALVERYDGDGKADMPRLEVPIKYWEVGNEPSMQSGFNTFFQGSSEDYLELLKVTYQAVKQADPEAKVLHAGMAGMEPWMVSFWEPIFEKGKQYFDIANIHSIGASEELNVPQFVALLSKYGVRKPIWVTEAQHRTGRGLKGGYISPEEHGQILAKSYVIAFAHGVDKVFYTTFRAPQSGPAEFKESALIAANGEKRPAYYALKTLIQKVDGFTSAERLARGRYRFEVGDKVVYALWGAGPLPPGIEGKVKVTEISGRERVVDAASLSLNDALIFVEVLPPEAQGSLPKEPGKEENREEGQGSSAGGTGIPRYPRATRAAVPDDMKVALGLPSEALCEGYTTAAPAQEVKSWYQGQMSAWSLEHEGSFSPPDRPGAMVYTQQYRKTDKGAFIVVQAVPQGHTFILIATGSWEAIQPLGIIPGEGGTPGKAGKEGKPGVEEGQGSGESYAELGSGTVTFTVSPVDPSYLKRVEPLGNLNPSAGHTFPTDHGGLEFSGIREIRAPADGVISEIRCKEGGDYRVVITHTNTFRSWFDHLATIEPSIMSQIEAVAGKLKPGQEARMLKVPIEAGQVIGTGPKGAVGIDWGVWDEEVTLGFIHPDKYGRMVHSVHFIPYCEAGLAETLLKKLPRTAEPRWGKIDFDQPGKLVGNWILKGTSGDILAEWKKQLAFVYDKYDPTQVRIAVGGVLNVPGEGKVYQVVGNSPDPAKVTPDSGLVVYRLRGLPEWGEGGLTATIIVQMVDEETIKVEGFPGHPSNPRFTSNAKHYTR